MWSRGRDKKVATCSEEMGLDDEGGGHLLVEMVI